MDWPFFLGEHICLSRWMWNLPLLIVLTSSSLRWSAVLGAQYASTVVLLCRDLPLSVLTVFLFFFFFGHVRPNSSRRGQETNPIFVLFFIDNKSASHFPWQFAGVGPLGPCPPSVRFLSLRRRYAVDLVHLPGPGRVQGATLQQPVDDVGARLPVLVSEQGVHKGVTGCFAVS